LLRFTSRDGSELLFSPSGVTVSTVTQLGVIRRRLNTNGVAQDVEENRSYGHIAAK